MTRTAKAASLTALLLAALGAPAVASAQMRGGGMFATPVGLPLDKVPVGTWAEYSMKRGDGPARTLRQALVAREKGTNVVEFRTQNQRGEKMLTRSVLGSDPTQEGGVKKVIVQMGDTDPMEMPAGGAGGPGGGGGGERGGGGMRGARFIKPDAKTLLGKETVKVAAGTFQTEHHRTEGRRGGFIDYWIAKESGPFGLVKLEMDRPGGGDGDDGGKLVVELSARGKDAKPELTKAAKPFDPEAMRGRFGGGNRGGGDRGPGDGSKPASGEAKPAGGEAKPPAGGK
jgi:hypothetical protein